MPLILTALPGQRWRVYMRPASEQGDLVDEATALLRRYLPAARFIGLRADTDHRDALARYRQRVLGR